MDTNPFKTLLLKPVWEWSKPGATVTVEFAGQKNTATAGKDGKWTVALKDLKASFEPAEMVIQGSGKTESLSDWTNVRGAIKTVLQQAP